MFAQFPFTYICIWNHARSVSFSDGGLRDRDIIFRDQMDVVCCFLGCEANSWRRRASSNPGDKVCVSFFSFFPFLVNRFSIFHDQTHTRTKTRKVRSDAERSKGDGEISVVDRGRPLRGQTRLAPRPNKARSAAKRSTCSKSNNDAVYWFSQTLIYQCYGLQNC